MSQPSQNSTPQSSQNSTPQSTAANTEQRRRRIFAILAIAIAAGALSFVALSGIGENLVYYWSPSELRAAGDQAVGATIRLGGLVADGSVRKASADGLSLEFDVTDGEETIHIVTESVPPAMFREGIGVVVEGTMTAEGRFATQRLMVKHDNEYRAPEDADARGMQELMESLQFDKTPGAKTAKATPSTDAATAAP